MTIGSAAAMPNEDVTLRLQQLLSTWRGAERGQQLISVHAQCENAAGPHPHQFLPAAVRFVPNLDVATLGAALARHSGAAHSPTVRFRVPRVGHVDAVLVPIGRAGQPADRWLLAIEQALPVRDQLALYAHAVGHLLLSREVMQMGRLPVLDPANGYAHADTLAELRQVESARDVLDRRVLETYPLLTALLRLPEQPVAASSPVLADLRQQLARRPGDPAAI